MTASGFVELRAAPAVCAGEDGRRSSARSVWVAYLAPTVALAEAARQVAARCPALPGRVHALGDFADPALHAALLAQLPAGCRLRQRFEWYACRGAGFHTDAHYRGVLFGAWCVAGPRREILFPRGSLRVAAAVGDLAVFDPFEPHAVLDPERIRYAREDFEDAPPSVFVGFEVELDDAARAGFDIGPTPAEGTLLSSAVPVNAETGALPDAP